MFFFTFCHIDMVSDQFFHLKKLSRMSYWHGFCFACHIDMVSVSHVILTWFSVFPSEKAISHIILTWILLMDKAISHVILTWILLMDKAISHVLSRWFPACLHCTSVESPCPPLDVYWVLWLNRFGCPYSEFFLFLFLFFFFIILPSMVSR